MDSKGKEIYSSEYQPKKDKIALSLLVGLFFSFNLMFFTPMDFYLSNVDSLLLPINYMFRTLIPATLLVLAIVFLICIIAGKKYHIIAASLFFGSGLAMYIQGSFLSLDLGELDGTAYRPGAVKIIINLIIWMIIISIPFLVYRFNRVLFKNFLAGGSFIIILIEIITIAVMMISFTLNDELGVLSGLISDNSTYICSTNGEYTYSSNKNYIVILTDEYDSFCFDAAVETDPDCVSGFDGFTYYTNTLGMYTYTKDAVPYILTGELNDSGTPYDNDFLFSALKEQYKMNIYGTIDLFPEQIYAEYAENYIKKEASFNDYIRLYIMFSRISLYRTLPELAKPAFWIYSGDFSDAASLSGMKGYYSDDLSFYNRLQTSLDITEENCFKFIYLYGLHDPRNITADLTMAKNWSVSGDEQAIALNKILSAYFDILKENGVYDNSEIVLLADHGIKTHDDGKYPLLMIKRAGEMSEGITVSNAPISHAELYPTLLYLAGYDAEEDTVFDIKEDEERERYFAGTDEYITGDIK